MHKNRNLVYSVTFFLVLLPFVLVTDLFPFLRFAMFAEPVKASVQTEMFLIMFETPSGELKRFDPEKYELQEESFQYLARNHYYRGESDLMLKKLNRSDLVKAKYWSFFKISFPVDFPEKRDTVLVTKLKNG